MHLMAQVMEFAEPLQEAVNKGAISPRQAWDLELLMEMEWEPTREDVQTMLWVNHVNLPVGLMTRQ
jgi:hypothetical protein